jgi:hypothetical protein
VSLRLPPANANVQGAYTLIGPGISDQDVELKRPPKGREVILGPTRLPQAGNFVAKGPNAWQDGFSMNIPVEESDLDKVSVESIEGLLGEGTISLAEKEEKLRDRLEKRFTQPIELFPPLMVLLLFILAFENLLANKFYRAPTTKKTDS